MKDTFPIITCDAEDGCDQWTLDWYEAMVSNWREMMEPNWQYEPYPYGNDKPHLCPEHNYLTVVNERPDYRACDGCDNGLCPGITEHCKRGEHCPAQDASCAVSQRLDPCRVCCSCMAPLVNPYGY